MNKFITTLAIAALACVATLGVASAQQYGYPYQNPYQNQYQYQQNGRWNNQNRATLRGTITAVNGNEVTLRLDGNVNGNRGYRDGDGDRDDNGQYNNGYYNNGQYNNGQYNNGQYNNGRWNNGSGYNGRQITINDQPALNNQTTGRVNVGRFVRAAGYWRNGTFFATSMN